MQGFALLPYISINGIIIKQGDRSILVIAYLFLQIALFIVQLFFSFKANMNRKEKRRVSYIRYSIDGTFIIGALLLMNEFPGQYSKLIMTGIILSVLGDIMISQALKLKNRLVLGMASFVAAHFFYISAFSELMYLRGARICNILPYTAVPYLIVTSALFIGLVMRPEYGKLINNAAFVYGLIVSLTAAFGGATAIGIGGVWGILGPATGLFLFSNVIIALTELGKHNIPKAEWLIWAAYSAAQIGIIVPGLL